MTLNMEAMMADVEAKKYIDDVQHEMEGNESISQMMDNASSIEELFDVAKQYVVMKFEDFKAICDDAFAYFSNKSKVALSDETMDMIVGGSVFGDIWNKCKKVVTAVAVGVAIAAVVAGSTAVMLAGGGLPLAAVVGTCAVCGGAAGVSGGMLQYLENKFINVG